ncbi:MAG: DUF1990 domain-containing protein [Planctomycetaceae bacterium]|nr:DUF1990 domain-containing protein [Planctomycetaceae bacterium]
MLSKPNQEDVRRFLQLQSSQSLSYGSPGLLHDPPPPGFTVDHSRRQIGPGRAAYDIARNSLSTWRQFDLGWVEPFPRQTPVKAGQCLAILARVLGIWWWNACRIVEVFDDQNDGRRFGFSYGTLPGHMECGEERFLVEIDGEDRVWYEILTYSRPHSRLARLGSPYARFVQRRFARESTLAMMHPPPTDGNQGP